MSLWRCLAEPLAPEGAWEEREDGRKRKGEEEGEHGGEEGERQRGERGKEEDLILLQNGQGIRSIKAVIPS